MSIVFPSAIADWPKTGYFVTVLEPGVRRAILGNLDFQTYPFLTPHRIGGLSKSIRSAFISPR